MTWKELESIAGIGLLALAVGNVAAEAAVTSVWIADGGDDHRIHVTAITDAEYAMGGTHTAYATAKIVSPSGRVAESTEWAEDWINAQVTLDIGSEDGTFLGYNWQPKEWCPFRQQFYYPPQQETSQNLPKWVAIISTSAPSAIGVSNSQGTFRVTVKTSTTCAGKIVVSGTLVENPPEIDAGIRAKKDDGGYSQTGVALYDQDLSANTSTPYDFIFGTNNNNTKTGSLQTVGAIEATPGCQWRTIAGVPLTRTIQVQSQ